jgi:hypothetical protein
MAQVTCPAEVVNCPETADAIGPSTARVLAPTTPPLVGDVLTVATVPAAPAPPTTVWAPGGGGAVASVFGRIGAVLAALGDYVTSLIQNDSILFAPLGNLQQVLNALESTATSVMVWGCGSLTFPGATGYLYPGGEYDQPASAAPIGFRMPRKAILNGISVRQNLPAALPGGTITYTLRVNGLPTAVQQFTSPDQLQTTVIIPVGVGVDQGDVIDLEVTTDGGVVNSPTLICCSLQLKCPTTP